MRQFIVLLFFLFFATAAYSENCSINDEIKNIVDNIVNNKSKKSFNELSKKPVESVCYLINNLHTISQTEIRPEERQNNMEAMKVIWSIRALRYLTNGKDFTSETSYIFNESEEDRKHFLTIFSEKDIPFFSVWMSRDIIYIAPEDVQIKIIEQWKRWYSENGKNFIYKSSEVMDWYY
jgi:uncharacterized protein YfcZ (UPF0381/DUF406 family)